MHIVRTLTYGMVFIILSVRLHDVPIPVGESPSVSPSLVYLLPFLVLWLSRTYGKAVSHALWIFSPFLLLTWQTDHPEITLGVGLEIFLLLYFLNYSVQFGRFSIMKSPIFWLLALVCVGLEVGIFIEFEPSNEFLYRIFNDSYLAFNLSFASLFPILIFTLTLTGRLTWYGVLVFSVLICTVISAVPSLLSYDLKFLNGMGDIYAGLYDNEYFEYDIYSLIGAIYCGHMAKSVVECDSLNSALLHLQENLYKWVAAFIGINVLASIDVLLNEVQDFVFIYGGVFGNSYFSMISIAIISLLAGLRSPKTGMYIVPTFVATVVILSTHIGWMLEYLPDAAYLDWWLIAPGRIIGPVLLSWLFAFIGAYFGAQVSRGGTVKY